ncbi:MAG: outer membrane lipoprotein-sorting protein [Fimbriimonadaceae bacterium]
MGPILALVAMVAPSSEPLITDYTQSGLRDLSFTAKVLSAKQAELKKINQDFSVSYRFSSSNVWLKEPMMLRMESVVDDTKIFYIVNGSKRLVSVPRTGLRQREDLSKAPGKRQTPLDFGLLTPSLFKGLFQAKYIRTETRGDLKGCLVFDLTYLPSLDDTSRNRVWVDPQRKYTPKREWYTQLGGYLLATFTYSDVKSVGGVYVPQKVSVNNSEGKFAGSTAYQNVKVNTGLAASLFDAS